MTLKGVKLWMLAAEFAMTPVDKRFKKNKNGIEDIEKGKEYPNRFGEFEKGLNNENN